jgi:hypothetical protein
MSKQNTTSSTSCYLQAVVFGKPKGSKNRQSQGAFESPSVDRKLNHDDLQQFKDKIRSYVTTLSAVDIAIELSTVCSTTTLVSRTASSRFLWEREQIISCSHRGVFNGRFSDFLNFTNI